MISKELASEIVVGLNIAYERNLPKDAVDTILLICSEFEAAQQSVQPTVATEPLEDSPWQTGARRGAVIQSKRNSG